MISPPDQAKLQTKLQTQSAWLCRMGLFRNAPFLPVPNHHGDVMANTCHNTAHVVLSLPVQHMHSHTHTQPPVEGSLKTVPIGVGQCKGPSPLKCHLPFCRVHSKGHLTSRKVRRQKVHAITVLLRVCQAAQCLSPL